MKRYLRSLFILIVSLCAIYGCEKQSLPMPDYPLDATTITVALKEAELSWSITEEETWSEGRTVYTINDKDGNLVVFLLSGTQNKRRLLDVSFMPYSDNPSITRSIPEEEWEKAIVFATLLYGGFEGKHQVYDSFINDYDTEDIVASQQEKIERHKKTMDNGEVHIWESKINDIYCIVRIEQPNINLPQKYLNTIRFDNTDGEDI